MLSDNNSPPSVLADKMEWSVTGVQLPMVVRLARF